MSSLPTIPGPVRIAIWLAFLLLVAVLAILSGSGYLLMLAGLAVGFFFGIWVAIDAEQ